MAKYDFNVIVIGAGSGGLVSAYISASVKAKVLLIEKHLMGGDCLNTGCVPSKTLIKSARYAHELTKASDYGFGDVSVTLDFNQVMQRVRDAIASIAPNDSTERYESLGVNCIIGEARVIDEHCVEVDSKRYTARNIIIATGASPTIPPIKGLKDVHYLTSNNVWELTELPKRLAVLGGGPIGCELSQAFQRLGSEVTQFEMAPRILGREDEEVSECVLKQLTADGINCLTSAKVVEVAAKGDGIALTYQTQGAENDQQEQVLEFDALLVAVGRTANVTGFGLEELGITLNKQHCIDTDPFLRTNVKSIYAVGDVAGPYQFTHFASYQAWFAAVNSLFAPVRFKADYKIIPKVTFTDPEVASVGLNEQEAQQQGIAYETSRFEYSHSDRAIADGATTGWIKVLTKPKGDKILGATIVGYSAGEIMGEMVLAMKYGLGLNKVLGTIHAYPTYIEINKSVAGVWRKAHQPEGILSLVAKWHKLRRG